MSSAAPAGQRNVISGNSGYGVTITGANSIGNVVSGNYIGLDGFSTSVSNTYNGIGIWAGSCSNVIGGSDARAGDVWLPATSATEFILATATPSARWCKAIASGSMPGSTGAVANSRSGLAIV